MAVPITPIGHSRTIESASASDVSGLLRRWISDAQPAGCPHVVIDLVELEADLRKLRNSALGDEYRPRHLRRSWWRRLTEGR